MTEHIEGVGMWGPRCEDCEQPWPCRAVLSERLAAVTAALEWRDLQREKVGCYVCGHQGRPYATTIYWDDQGRPHGFWTCSEEHRLQMVRERNPYLAAHPAAGQPAPASAEGA